MFAGKRQRADWVYRPNMFDDTGALIDQQGTYDQTIATITPGVVNSQAFWLYDSVNRLKQLGAIGGANFVQVPRVARAEGRNPLVLAVELTMFITPSTWALGSQFRHGIRLMTIDQDPDDGLALFNAEYTMWDAAGAGLPRAAIFANEKNLWREWRFARFFNNDSTTPIWAFYGRWRGRRSIRPEQGLALFHQTDNTAATTTLQIQRWCRTLVVDEG